MNYDYDLLVIGGGAAGYFGALSAAEKAPTMRIAILEKTGKLLSKVRISGGGRCNVTNAERDLKVFSKSYPRGEKFIYRLLHLFGPDDTVNWFLRRGVRLVAEPDGRMFPESNNSASIVNCLTEAAEKAGINVLTSTALQSLQEDKVHQGFQVITSTRTLFVRYVLIASGGYHHLRDYAWISANQIRITPPVPSLFTFNLPQHPAQNLMGIALPVRVKIDQTKLQEQGPLLITHWGFSGPAVLRCSAWGARILAEREYRFTPRINWLPDLQQEEVAEWLLKQKVHSGSKKMSFRVFDALPQRMWEYLLVRTGIDPESRWNEQKDSMLRRLAETLNSDVYHVSGKTTFKEEFVTSGGIALEEIDSQTCQLKKLLGVFVAGEAMDADGITGGFNFQQAWSSGWIAGNHCAKLFNSHYGKE